MNTCNHIRTKTTPTPELKHYAKTTCNDCGAFLRWEPQPETEKRRAETAKRIAVLSKSDRLNEWEKQFVASLSEKGPKFSPRQLEILERVWTEKGA